MTARAECATLRRWRRFIRGGAAAGFVACYVSGAAAANGAGLPDIGLVTLTGMCRTVAEVGRGGDELRERGTQSGSISGADESGGTFRWSSGQLE